MLRTGTNDIVSFVYTTDYVKWLFFVFVQGSGVRGKDRITTHIARFFSDNLFLYCMKQMDSMLPCVCSVVDHRRR